METIQILKICQPYVGIISQGILQFLYKQRRLIRYVKCYVSHHIIYSNKLFASFAPLKKLQQIVCISPPPTRSVNLLLFHFSSYSFHIRNRNLGAFTHNHQKTPYKLLQQCFLKENISLRLKINLYAVAFQFVLVYKARIKFYLKYKYK